MKDFVFISDFDGTLTHKDFYYIIMEKYLGEKGKNLYADWKEQKITDFEFLNIVFSSINMSEKEILEEIINISFDKYAKGFIESVKSMDGDFVILSAGTSYYIYKILEHYNISDVLTISNKGVFKDKGIHMIFEPNGRFFSQRYGVDKMLAVEHFKKEYKKIYYAGDSEPDLKACMKADLVFAKGRLQNMLIELNHPFIPIENFNEIGNYLNEKGVIKYENIFS